MLMPYVLGFRYAVSFRNQSALEVTGVANRSRFFLLFDPPSVKIRGGWVRCLREFYQFSRRDSRVCQTDRRTDIL